MATNIAIHHKNWFESKLKFNATQYNQYSSALLNAIRLKFQFKKQTHYD